MISKEDVLQAVAESWWEAKPKIIEFVNQSFDHRRGADIYPRAYLFRCAFPALVR